MRVDWDQWQIWSQGVFALSRAFALAACGIGFFAWPALADDSAASPKFSWREMWGGADATKDVWLLYTGVTLAPLSPDIYSNGLRFRMTSGYGQYSIDLGAPRVCSGGRDATNSCTTSAGPGPRAKVSVTYTDALAGYHWQLGNLTAKAFVGASMYEHDAPATSYTNKLSGREIGLTGALEFWLNVNEQSWTSLDLSYTTAHDTGSARWRAGWRALPTLSVGPEARFDRNTLQASARLGVFARYEWFGGEISAAAGLAQTICDPYSEGTCGASDQMRSPYATVNYLTQF